MKKTASNIRRWFHTLRLILFMDCETSARLTSDSFERSLSAAERLGLRIHQFLCRNSYRLARQMEMMETELQSLARNRPFQPDRLSQERREAIRQQLQVERDGRG